LVAYDAFLAFIREDGWAIASHISLSILMSMFPFLIFVTALAGFLFDFEGLSNQVAELLLQAWPPEVAGPIAAEIARVLTNTHGSAVTAGVVLALYFSSSGIESLRIGLNRAYGEVYFLVGAVALILLDFQIVLAPVVILTAQR
jgi:membrane protein